MNPNSNNNKRYFINLSNGFSRTKCVYFIKEKYEAVEMFRNFEAIVETGTKQHIQCLQTYRGGEYTSSKFVSVCERNGINRWVSASCTTHQNGM